MPSLDEMQIGAASHAQQLAARKWFGVADLAARWGVSKGSVRKIPREKLPYIEFGETHIRRYDPKDVEAFERSEKVAA